LLGQFVLGLVEDTLVLPCVHWVQNGGVYILARLWDLEVKAWNDFILLLF
jgi:hypothetical protein